VEKFTRSSATTLRYDLTGGRPGAYTAVFPRATICSGRRHRALRVTCARRHLRPHPDVAQTGPRWTAAAEPCRKALHDPDSRVTPCVCRGRLASAPPPVTTPASIIQIQPVPARVSSKAASGWCWPFGIGSSAVAPVIWGLGPTVGRPADVIVLSR
jgi:hypothetical protein